MNLSFPAVCRILIIIAVSFVLACKKNDTAVLQPPVPPPPPPPVVVFVDESVTASLNGRIIDEAGKPVEQVLVKAGNNSVMSDVNGLFRFNNILFGKNAGSVVAEKEGYFKTGKTFVTNAGSLNNVTIQLITKTDRGNFSSSSGGTIVIQNGSSVKFKANSITNTQSNTSYSGTVQVKGAYLDPSDPGMPGFMPGNLMGLNTQNELKLLKTFGMLAVELEGAAGEKLNIAPGNSAELTMPIPASMQSNAPDSIPLWYFNDTTGLWKQQGYATKNGTNYTGSVSHFSFWNCDIPLSFIKLTLNLTDNAQQPLSWYKVTVTNTLDNSSGSGYTDSAGTVSGYVPGNVPLTVKVYNHCNDVIYTQNAGPYSGNTNMGTLVLTIPAVNPVTISGTLKNCNNSNVTNGFVQVFADGNYTTASVTNGIFSLTINRCSSAPATGIVYGVDLDANQASDTMTIEINSDNKDIGNINACGISNVQFVNFTINSQSINFTYPEDSILLTGSNGVYNIEAFRRQSSPSAYQYVSFGLRGEAVAGAIHFVDSSNLIVVAGDSVEYNLKNSANATITEWGVQGQFVGGNFTGNFKDRLTSAIVPGSCSFRVRKYF